MMKKIFGTTLSLILIVLVVSGCQKWFNKEDRSVIHDREYIMIVASSTVPGLVGEGTFVVDQVLAIKKGQNEEWSPLARGVIEGFTYEAGYEYELRIKETAYLDWRMGTPAWTEYVLLDTISKTAKESEGVPDTFIPEWWEEG